VQEVPHHPDDPGHVDRSADLKRVLLPTRDDAVAAVCPPPDRPQDVEVYRSDRSQMASTCGVRQLAVLSSPKIWDRSRSGSSAERDDDTIMNPPPPQKPHDPPATVTQADSRQVARSRGTRDSFDHDNRGLGLWERSEGSRPPGRKGHGPQEREPSKSSVPKVVLIPPTRSPSPAHIPPELTPIAPTPTAPTPPERLQLEHSQSALMPRTQPSRQPQPDYASSYSSSHRALSSQSDSVPVAVSARKRRKKSLLSIICPCLG
jgi:hypothetical protein